MRTVAALMALSFLVLIAPAGLAADECFTNATQQACVSIPVSKPAPPAPAPGVPPQLNPYWSTYYIWIGPGPCSTDPLSNQCRGTPPSAGSGIPLPTGADTAAGAGVFGTIWKESNNCAGLQRRLVTPCLPDRMILV